jgi:hypothetical protein
MDKLELTLQDLGRVFHSRIQRGCKVKGEMLVNKTDCRKLENFALTTFRQGRPASLFRIFLRGLVKGGFNLG